MTATPVPAQDRPSVRPPVTEVVRPTGVAEGARLSYEERAERTDDLLARAATSERGSAERQALLDEVVVVNMRVAQAVARRYRNRGISLDDLTQIAYTALVRAVHEFDPGHGRDLLVYAVPTMTGELRRYFRDQGWVVRPPRDVQRAHGRLVRQGASPERLDDAGLSRLAAELGEDAAVLTQALRLHESENVLSLERSGSETGEALSHRVADAGRAAEQSEAHLVLAPALADLDPAARQVLTWRFVDEASQREIAARLDCSQVQVSRLLRRILDRLRAAISDEDEAGADLSA